MQLPGIGLPDRRVALKAAGSTLVAATLKLSFHWEPKEDLKTRKVKLGVIADLHGGFAEDAERRLDAFVDAMAAEADCDALVQLGDFAYPNQNHQVYADRFNEAHERTIHVVGNHDLDLGLTLADCQKAWGTKSSYYATDIGDLRIVVLDGNEKGSPDYERGYPSFIGAKQLKWLAEELASNDRPTVILSHQPLAGSGSIDNAKQVQELLSDHAEKIVICLNGHTHLDSLHRVGEVNYLHLNSASYFWVGGEVRRAYYSDPLYSTVTIDLENSEVVVSGKASTWRDRSPEQLGYFKREGRPPEEAVTPQIRDRRISDT